MNFSHVSVSYPCANCTLSSKTSGTLPALLQPFTELGPGLHPAWNRVTDSQTAGCRSHNSTLTCVCQLLSLQSEHSQLQTCTLQRQPYFCGCKHALCNGNVTFVAANIPPATTLLFSMQNSSDFRVCRFKYFQLQILSCLENPAGHICGCKLWGKFAAAKTKSSWVLQKCLPQIGLQKQ